MIHSIEREREGVQNLEKELHERYRKKYMTAVSWLKGFFAVAIILCTGQDRCSISQ